MLIMWPMILDYSKHECQMMLRNYELEAYSNVMTALRAQGDLNIERKKILRDLASILSIPLERHRSEVRRVLNDEKLYTVAYNVSGPNVYYEWTIEGKRLIPLLPRIEPQTAFTRLADICANKEATQNMSLPEPSKTRSLKIRTESIPEDYHLTNKKPKIIDDSKIFDSSTLFNSQTHMTSLPTNAIEKRKPSLPFDFESSKRIQSPILTTQVLPGSSEQTKSFTNVISKNVQSNSRSVGNGEIARNISQTSTSTANLQSSSFFTANSSRTATVSTASSISLQSVIISTNSSSASIQNTPSIFTRCIPSTSTHQLLNKSDELARPDVKKLVSKCNDIPVKGVYLPMVKSNERMLNNATVKFPNSTGQQLYLYPFNGKLSQLNPSSISKANHFNKPNLASTSKVNHQLTMNNEIPNGRLIAKSKFSYSSVNISNKSTKTNPEVNAHQVIQSTASPEVIELKASTVTIIAKDDQTKN